MFEREKEKPRMDNPNAASAFLGPGSKITGTVKLVRGKPRIDVTDPGQIKIVPEKSRGFVHKMTHIYKQVGDLPTELVQDFFEGFAAAARANVHLKVLYGRSSHHQIEAVFKAFARALRVACAKDKRLARMLPSTKGLM